VSAGAPCSEYTATMRAVRGRMLARSGSSDLLYVAELVDGAAVPKMDHLVCFLPGLLALGHLHGINTGASWQCFAK
jgi:mannosyl-oligosaccharide alpha-1,2-mannosidase